VISRIGFQAVAARDHSSKSGGIPEGLARMSDTDAIIAANAAYYRAFSTGDVAAMDQIWADDGVSCVHPGWTPLIGRGAVVESYRNILTSPNRVRIAHREDTAIVTGDEGRVVCIEIVEGTALLAATNFFRRVGGAWRMVHHQASPIAVAVEEGESSPPRGQRLN
jgi:ketosteroid isomerase-like protein